MKPKRKMMIMSWIFLALSLVCAYIISNYYIGTDLNENAALTGFFIFTLLGGMYIGQSSMVKKA